MPTTLSATALNDITSTIISTAIDIHRACGCGLLESAYDACTYHVLRDKGLAVERQKALPLVYKGVRIDCAYRVDLIVESAVVVEVKAIEALHPIHSQQLFTYLRLADCPVGLILNFGAAVMRDGIKRMVNGFPGPKERDERWNHRT